jgi:hypothetical protein
MALAIGYDWLYDHLTIQTRKILVEAILEKGLQPSLDEQSERNYWLKAEHNWNQVCHTGMVFGALAIQEDAGDLAARIIARAMNGVPLSMKSYAPDGAYPEGPGYWEYGTTFNVLLIAALESALGSSFGLTEQKGFMKTADYYLHMTGPTGLYFNYSDCGVKGSPSPAMAWFAKRLHAPYLFWDEAPSLQDYNRKQSVVASSDNRHSPLFLIWNLSAKEISAPTAFIGRVWKRDQPDDDHRIAFQLDLPLREIASMVRNCAQRGELFHGFPYYLVRIHSILMRAAGAFLSANCHSTQKYVKRWSWGIYWLTQAAWCWFLWPRSAR